MCLDCSDEPAWANTHAHLIDYEVWLKIRLGPKRIATRIRR